MVRHATRAAVVAAAFVVANAAATADLVSVGPFTGSATETFNQYTNTMAVQSLPVFGGLGELQNLSDGGAIKVEFSSSLNGDLVTPISGLMAGQLGIAQWVFSTPVLRFGGWWENNSGADDATLLFYDADDQLIGETVAEVAAAAQQWTWNGWASDTPISRIVVTGNGLINGFLWYENMQIDVVPGPATGALFPIAAILARRRRSRRP